MATTKKKTEQPKAPAEAPAPNQAKVHQGVLVDVALLKDHPDNYKKHPPEQIKHLMKSIDEHGFYRNVVIARDNTILAGHGVVQAVREMGIFGPKQVPATKLDIDARDPQAIKIMFADNEIGLLADINHRAKVSLAKLLGKDLEGTGLDELILGALEHGAFGPEGVDAGDGDEIEPDAEAHYAAAGAPAFDGRTGVWKLVLDFESKETREAFIEKHGIVPNSSKRPPSISAWYPPRKKNDPTSLFYREEEEGQEAAK